MGSVGGGDFTLRKGTLILIKAKLSVSDHTQKEYDGGF